MYTGTYRASCNEVKCVEDTSSLCVGDLVAVHCEESSSEPAIATCLSIGESKIKVKWMKGSYSSSWKAWTLREGRKNADCVDEIPKSAILLYSFELTQTGHLRKRTIEHLKSAYSKEPVQ